MSVKATILIALLAIEILALGTMLVMAARHDRRATGALVIVLLDGVALIVLSATGVL